MRIVKDDDSSLVLRDRSLWLSFIFVAATTILLIVALGARRWNALMPSALFGIFAVAFLRSSDVAFDKRSKVCTIRRRDMWRTTTTVIPFGSIREVRVEPMQAQSGSAVLNCRLSLETSTGVVPLTATFGPDLDRYEAMRQTVLATLTPTSKQLSHYDPVNDLVAAGRTIDAVNLIRRRKKLSLTEARDQVARLQASLRTRGGDLRP